MSQDACRNTHTLEIAPALSCSECLNEIPASVADSLEGKDYIHYFCGLECYAMWEDRAADRNANEDV